MECSQVRPTANVNANVWSTLATDCHLDHQDRPTGHLLHLCKGLTFVHFASDR